MTTTTYSWTLPQIDVAPSLDGLSNVVTCIHWRLKGKRGANSAETYGTVELPQPTGSAGFIPLASLTEAQALEWVTDRLGDDRVTELKASLIASLDDLESPSVVAMAPPWANQETNA